MISLSVILSLLKMSVSLQIALAAEINPADGLTLKLWLTTNVQKCLIILLGIFQLTVSNIEIQLILFLNTLIRKRASRCFRLK
jgi:hypothetical protein